MRVWFTFATAFAVSAGIIAGVLVPLQVFALIGHLSELLARRARPVEILIVVDGQLLETLTVGERETVELNGDLVGRLKRAHLVTLRRR